MWIPAMGKEKTLVMEALRSSPLRASLRSMPVIVISTIRWAQHPSAGIHGCYKTASASQDARKVLNRYCLFGTCFLLCWKGPCCAIEKAWILFIFFFNILFLFKIYEYVFKKYHRIFKDILFWFSICGPTKSLLALWEFNLTYEDHSGGP